MTLDIQLFKEFFKGRTDTFAEQTVEGYVRLNRPLQDNDILHHINGHSSYGIYLIEPVTNLCWHTVIDIDNLDKSLLESLIASALKLGLEKKQFLPEFSGNKGYHIWFFAEEKISADKMQKLGQIIVAQSGIERSIEVFPKQSQVAENGFGNLIKLPLGIHKKTGKWSQILDNELNPVHSWEKYLPYCNKINKEQIDAIIKEFGYLLPKRSIIQSNSDMKTLPCFKRIMEFGVAEGQRDNIAFRLAIFLKKQGLTAELALSALRDWNKKNKPPLEDYTISDKIKSAYENGYSGFGCDQDYMKEFCSVECPVYRKSEIIQGENIPVALPEFMNKDIPPVEYYAYGILPKKGKGMVSAQANIGKSLFVQNLALMIASGKEQFLSKFTISPAKVLYLDLEMGESALKERFGKMQAEDNITAPNLYVMYLPSINILDETERKKCEKWLADLGIEVLIIDPLGNAWQGDPNDQQQVAELTAYLNNLIEKYNVSILVVHHWRKATKEYKSGGQMAAGSYKWEAWLDCHITLEGMSSSITISSQKSRNAPRFNPFLAKINGETLWFEYLTDYEKKYTEDTLIRLFEVVGAERVAVADLVKLAKERRICSGNTLRKLIDESTIFEKYRGGNKDYISKKNAANDLLDNVSNVQKG